MHITVRAAVQADNASWFNLRAALWPDCTASRHQLEIKQLLAGPGMVALAFADGEIAGFAEASVRGEHVEGTTQVPVPYLEGWYVTKGYRGLGIGKSLLAFVEQWAISCGFGELASDAEIDNERSIGLHSKLGFRVVGRNVHFVKSLHAPVHSQSSDIGFSPGASATGLQGPHP